MTGKTGRALLWSLLLGLSGGVSANDWQVLNNEAKSYFVQGQYEKSAAKSKEALQLAEASLGKESPDLIPLMNNLARTYRMLGQDASAEPIYRQVLGLSEKKLGATHPNLALILTNLAQTQQTLRNFKDAEANFKRALSIREKAFGIGPQHPDSAQTLISLSSVQLAQGNLAGAEAGFKKALAVLESVQGVDSPNTLSALQGLAQLYKTQKTPGLSEYYLKRVLGIKQKTVGVSPAEIESLLTELVAVQMMQSRYDEAETTMEALVDSQGKRQAPYAERAASYEKLIALHKTRNQPAQMEAVLKQLLALNEKAKGPRSTEVLETLDRLVEVLSAQGKSEAKRYADQAARIRNPGGKKKR